MTVFKVNEQLWHSGIVRTIEAGGLSKADLIDKLQEKNVFLNDLGKQLLLDERMSVSKEVYLLKTIELTVGDLGFIEGAVLPDIYARSIENGLSLCPVETGPYLRLAYLDQPEGYTGKPVYERQAPYGSITIASEKIDKEEDFPQGFYIRKIEGNLWLRGYVADDLHIWNPNDRFLFCCFNQ
ncbi:MAG: hypothetical protein ABS913_10645 [Desemzia incerta]|uniref:hypothetical protein n=1 Tax=Desemzia incerta TaxID=82801 RepID=UPI003315343F